MRIIFISFLIAICGIIMFQLGKNSQKQHLEKTIVLKSEGIKPSEGDLLRVQYVSNDSVYLCVID
jgi:hypothetical protein